MTTVVFSIWQLSMFLKKNKLIHLAAGFSGIGLSMLTKGPIGLALPVFALGTDILLKRNRKAIFRWEWLAGLIIVALVISPALTGILGQFGKKGILFYFWGNNAGRITGTLHSNSSDPFYYLHTLSREFIPWSFLVLYGLYCEVKKLVLQRFRYKTLNAGMITVLSLAFLFNAFIVPLSYRYHAMLQASYIVNTESRNDYPFVMFSSGKSGFSDDTFNFYLIPDPSYTNDIATLSDLEKGWVFTGRHDLALLQKNGFEFIEVHPIPHLPHISLKFPDPETRNETVRMKYLILLQRSAS
ncbi:MAG: hypothetical protein PVF73_08220 [Bacteroidales bacterium]|jgi:hypothetical protein